MSDKPKVFAAPSSKTIKGKRPSTVSVASSSRKVPSTIVKTKTSHPKLNSTVIGESDVTVLKTEVPDFEDENRAIAYGKFLRAMLEECLVDEKIEREETQMDVQMAQLADRFQKTIDHLDKTNRRIKDISFVAEQKRLLDLKTKDCDRFYEITSNSSTVQQLELLKNTEQACLDQLQTKNIDFGYNKDSGHKMLLEAVTDAIEGLENIKKHSNLDINKFKEYEKTQKSMTELEKERRELEILRADFEKKFPDFTEKLFKEASDKIAQMINNDD